MSFPKNRWSSQWKNPKLAAFLHSGKVWECWPCHESESLNGHKSQRGVLIDSSHAAWFISESSLSCTAPGQHSTSCSPAHTTWDFIISEPEGSFGQPAPSHCNRWRTWARGSALAQMRTSEPLNESNWKIYGHKSMKLGWNKSNNFGVFLWNTN